MTEVSKARVVLCLHAHLPYVRIPDKKFPLQELWLFQALTESYIPLIMCFRELIEEKINFKITFSISPTLLSMISDDYYILKYQDYLRTLLELLRRKSLNAGNEQKRSIKFFLNRIQTISNFFIEIKGDLVGELKSLSQTNKVNLITTSATHALLPLLSFSNNLVRSQISIGQKAFRKKFEYIPKGFWLPEMGYYAGLHRILSDNQIKYTFLDAHSIYLAPARPSYGNFYPSVTSSNLKIFPRDLPLSNTIWSSSAGYPGDHRYREFHYDFTYSLSEPELNEFGIDRVPFGLKIYRITGNGKEKEFYNREEALEAVGIHSEDFVNKIIERTRIIKPLIGRVPVFTLPFDAELFGHWWFEGPEFLKQTIKKISASKEIDLALPDEIEGGLETIEPAESSWGRGGFFKSWTNPECSWIYPDIARLNAKLNNAVSDRNGKVITQAIKEILLASSSDWTFLVENDSSGDYGKMRMTDHINSAKKLLEGIESGNPDDNFLSSREALYPVFKDLVCPQNRCTEPILVDH